MQSCRASSRLAEAAVPTVPGPGRNFVKHYRTVLAVQRRAQKLREQNGSLLTVCCEPRRVMGQLLALRRPQGLGSTP